MRAKQINNGADPFIDVPNNMIEGLTIAEKELEDKKVPFIIRRPLPNGSSEYWKVKDLEMNGGMIDVILSDMAPKTTGIRDMDAHRSFELNQQVLELSLELLRSHGTLLVKAFQGAHIEKLCREFNKSFAQVKLCKPKSSRSESVEIFVLGLKKK